MSELLASVDKVCKFNNDVSYWGGKAESEFLRTSFTKSQGSVTYTCEGDGDATWDSLYEYDLRAQMTENQIDITNQDGLSAELGTAKKIKLWSKPYIAFKAKCRDKTTKVKDNE